MEEIVRSVAQGSSAIAYGRLIRGSDHRRGPLFRVRHVYRGALRPGQMVKLQIGWSIPAPPCFGMLGRPHTPGAWSGVAVLEGREMRFLMDDQVALMLRLGLLVPGPHDRRAE